MGDNVTIPVAPSTAVIATDEVDLGSGLAQVQFGKLVDGTDGGTNRLLIDQDGAIKQGRSFGTIFAMVNPGETSYADGEVVGGFGGPVAVPTGFYAVRSVGVAAFAGQDLTGLEFHVLGFGNATGTTPALPADGDTMDLFGLYGSLVILDAEDTGMTLTGGGTFGGVSLQSRVDLSYRVQSVLAAGGSPGPGELCDFSVGLVASGAVATDLTAGPLGIIIQVEKLSTTPL